MVAMRMIALTIALAFSTPAIAQDQVSPYTTIGQGGGNNALDINAAGACPGGLTDGCSSVFTALPTSPPVGTSAGQCKAEPGKICYLKGVPANACSAGTNNACIFPNGWNTAVDPPVPTDAACKCTGSLAEAAADPALNFESTACGGFSGRCSDGDPRFLEGGMGVALGTRITFSDSYTNVGQDSNGAVGVLNGIGLTGPRFGLENPPIIITPQRRPGTGASAQAIGTEIVDLGGSTAFAVVPNTGALDSNVFTDAGERAHWTALRDEFGVRYYRGFSDSLFSEWVFNSGELSGSKVDSLIVTHPCNANRGWSTDDPTAGVCENDTNTACTDNFPASAVTDACGMLAVPACATNIGNPQNAVGCPNNCIPTEFCWQQAESLGTRGFIWSRDIAAGELTDTNKSLVVAAGGDISGKCPPDCGLDYFWNVFEQEAIDNLLATPEKPGAPQLPDPNFRILPNIGFQAAFDHYSGGTAGEGDTLAIILVFSQTWINSGDLRCYIGGENSTLNDGNDPNNFRRTGFCDGSLTACVPFAEDVPNILGAGISMDDCPGSGSTLDCLGCGATPPHLVPVTMGGTWDLGTGVQTPVFPSSANDPVRAWVPPGYNEHSGATDGCGGPSGACASELSLLNVPGRTAGGRVGGLINKGYTVKVPLLVPGTTGYVGSQFRDNGVGGFDDCGLGCITPGTGGAGITLANPVFAAGSTLAWNGETVQVADEFTMPAVNPGTIQDPNFFLAFATNYGPGVDGIPACIGDNNNNFGTPCDEPLGQACPTCTNNTGLDDFPQRTQHTRPPLAPAANCGPGTASPGGAATCNMFTTQQDLRPNSPNPTAQFPAIIYVGAGSGRDVPVVLPTDTDFVFKFDTVLCPSSGDQGDCGGGIGDADLDRIGNGFDACPSAFDPSQAASSTAGTSGTIGAACLCGDTSVTPGLISIPDAQVIALTALGFPTGGQTATAALADITRTGSLSIGDAQQTAFAALGFAPFTSKCDLNCPAAPKTTDNTSVATFVYERAGCN